MNFLHYGKSTQVSDLQIFILAGKLAIFSHPCIFYVTAGTWSVLKAVYKFQTKVLFSGEDFYLSAGYILIAWVISQVLSFLTVVNASCYLISSRMERGNLCPSAQLHRERKPDWQVLKISDMVLQLKFLFFSRQPDPLIFHLLFLFLYRGIICAFSEHSLP